jgi:membrane protein implicated in regulation of membrane protease activity
MRSGAEGSRPKDKTMDWDNATFWWVLAGVLVAVELMTGSFYLLMLALGAAAAALAAHLGASQPAQWTAAALVGGGATVLWHFKRKRTNDVGDRLASRDVSLDVGEIVTVQAWQSDGSSEVQFRGSTWQARFEGPGTPTPGLHTIVALQGNRLMLAPKKT